MRVRAAQARDLQTGRGELVPRFEVRRVELEEAQEREVGFQVVVGIEKVGEDPGDLLEGRPVQILLPDLRVYVRVEVVNLDRVGLDRTERGSLRRVEGWGGRGLLPDHSGRAANATPGCGRSRRAGRGRDSG